jgi:hypothetical protein
MLSLKVVGRFLESGELTRDLTLVFISCEVLFLTSRFSSLSSQVY